MKNITDIINSLINHDNYLHNKTIEGFDSINLIFNIDELIDQLGTIDEAITLARRSIPSSRIISTDDTNIAQQFLENSGLGISTVNDIYDISIAYMLFGKDEIIYTLKIPRIKKVKYQLSFIEPVISHNHRLHLKAKYYLKGPSSFLTNTPCKPYKNQFICDGSQLEPLEKCIQQLVIGEPADCPIEKVYGQNIIRKIDDANIMISATSVILTTN